MKTALGLIAATVTILALLPIMAMLLCLAVIADAIVRTLPYLLIIAALAGCAWLAARAFQAG